MTGIRRGRRSATMTRTCRSCPEMGEDRGARAICPASGTTEELGQISEEEGWTTRMTTRTMDLCHRGCRGGTRPSSGFSQFGLLRLHADGLLADRDDATLPFRLYMGHLVLDSPVPSKLLVHCPNKTDKEFTTMRCAPRRPPPLRPPLAHLGPLTDHRPLHPPLE